MFNIVCLRQVKKVKTFEKMAEDIKCLSKEKNTRQKLRKQLKVYTNTNNNKTANKRMS